MNNQTHWKRQFLTIMSGQTISLIGTSAVQFSIIWWLASGTNSAMMLAVAGFLAFLPNLILGPFAGVWVDRMKRKRLVILSDMFMGVIALVFSFFFMGGQPPYWTACLVLAVRGFGGVFHTPAFQAIIPLLVPKEELVKANGWSQFLQSGGFMLGPVLGAAMYAALPLWLILMTDFLGAVFACSTMAVVKIPELPPQKKENPHFFHEMKEGAAALMADKKLFTITIVATVCMVFFMPLSSYYPLMSSTYFAATAWHGSLVEMVYAVGMMVFALIMSRTGRVKNKLLLSYVGLLGTGVASLIGGIVPPQMWAFWVFAASCLLLGGFGTVFNIPYMAYLQGKIPPQAMGRVFSLIGSLMSIAMPVGLLLSGPIAEKYGVNIWFFITGVAIIAVTAVMIILECMSKKKEIE